MGWGMGIPIGWPNATSGGASPILDVLIGSQIWTLKNLEVTKYNNGDVIPQVTDPIQWAALTTGAWCYYNNDSANGQIYGKLYNWHAVNDPRGLAPSGYHVPSDAEWTTLTTYLGGDVVAGGKIKSTGTTLWDAPNQDATNSSGFTGLPGGNCSFDGQFLSINSGGYWWTSSESSLVNAIVRYAIYGTPSTYSSNSLKTVGFSIRLIKD